MKVDLPLEEMSVSEKIRMMELLWTNLSKTSPDDVVPAWHADVLAQREERVSAGLEKSIPWEEAKTQLRQKIHDLKSS